jgi:hypothetical protein
VIPSQQIPKPIRETQDPLSHLHVRKDVIHEVRGALRHAPPATGRTEAAAFARERHQSVVLARVAVKSRESGGEAAAGQKLAKFALHEPRQAFPVAKPSGLRAKRLEVVADETVKDAVYRIARLILHGGRHGRGTRGDRAIACRDESGGNRVSAASTIVISATPSPRGIANRAIARHPNRTDTSLHCPTVDCEITPRLP